MTDKEPDYYAGNGLSPIGAFQQGLISKDEYIGFLKGNIIKYTVRAGHKEDTIKDLEKAKHYIDFYLELLENNELEDIINHTNDIVSVLEELNERVSNLNKRKKEENK